MDRPASPYRIQKPVAAALARPGGRQPHLDRALMLAMPVAQAALFTLFIHHYFVG